MEWIERPMDYRIEKKEAFRIVGASSPLDPNVEKSFADVPALWQKVVADGSIPRIFAHMNTPPFGLLGVSFCSGVDEWRYFIAVSSTMPADELDEATVPAFTWAVFPGTGACPDAIQDLERRIVTEWLPTSGYEYADGPDVELYLSPDMQNAKFEVWIPVVKK